NVADLSSPARGPDAPERGENARALIDLYEERNEEQHEASGGVGGGEPGRRGAGGAAADGGGAVGVLADEGTHGPGVRAVPVAERGRERGGGGGQGDRVPAPAAG